LRDTYFSSYHGALLLARDFLRSSESVRGAEANETQDVNTTGTRASSVPPLRVQREVHHFLPLREKARRR